MPDITVDIVAEVIFLARKSSDPETGGSDADAQLRGYLENLAEDERMDLVAIMWLGREDFTAAEWDEARQTAFQEHAGGASEYLVATPLLADYLEDGLDALDIAVSDAEDSVL